MKIQKLPSPKLLTFKKNIGSDDNESRSSFNKEQLNNGTSKKQQSENKKNSYVVKINGKDKTKKRSAAKGKNKKAVSFRPSVRVHPIISRKDMTPEQKREIWISYEEILAIHRRDQKFIETTRESGNSNVRYEDDDDEQHCLRGLEIRAMPREERRVQRNRVLTWDAVLDEQEYRWKNHRILRLKNYFDVHIDGSGGGGNGSIDHVDDDVAIAFAYRSTRVSVDSQLRAHRMALQDEAIARKIHNDEEK